MKRSLFRCVKAAAVLGLAMTVAGPVKADLVVNGDFGTGDFTGWTLTGDSSQAFVSVALRRFAGGGSTTSTADGFLTQNLATTAGLGYTVSFSLAGDGAHAEHLLGLIGWGPHGSA